MMAFVLIFIVYTGFDRAVSVTSIPFATNDLCQVAKANLAALNLPRSTESVVVLDCERTEQP